MSSPSFASFPPANSKDWNEAARKELKGKDPFESLSVKKHDLAVKPYYDASDTGNTIDFNLSPSADSFLGSRAWHNTPIVTVDDDKKANKIALDHLRHGADGIIYRISGPTQVENLLRDIELPYCSSYFLFDGSSSTFIPELIQFANAKGFDKAQIVGGIFWNGEPQDQNDLVKKFQEWGKFHVMGNIVSINPNPVEEIVEALIKGVDILDNHQDINLAFQHLTFSFHVGHDFFLEIAKLKVFRRLWHQVRMAYSIDAEKQSVLIHGLSACWNNEKYQPNANMLKSTTSALSCILGGCDLITVEPEDERNAFKSRIARNVLTLLREESHLNQPADATAGSYYLEDLMDQMAKQAWSQFQKAVAK